MATPTLRRELTVRTALAIQGLSPCALWHHFGILNTIPRDSRNEREAIGYIESVATKHGCVFKRDEYGNLAVYVPASVGRELEPPVCIQAHVDMVCRKGKDHSHDFSRDPIEMIREGDLIRADGTTLGADNGIGVGAMLALMTERGISHPPLELLFTVEEEVGLLGAKNLGSDMITARQVINLDWEEWGQVGIGCAGSGYGTTTFPLKLVTLDRKYRSATIKVSGLRGGHSGADIHRPHTNAIKILAETLLALGSFEVRVADISGGEKRNGIPAEATARVFIESQYWDMAEQMFRSLSAETRQQLAEIEPALKLELCDNGSVQNPTAINPELQWAVIGLLNRLPHGVRSMHTDLPSEVVKTSNNLAIVSVSDDTIVIETMYRSSSAQALLEIREIISVLSERAGATFVESQPAPAWQPNWHSGLAQHALEIYQARFGETATLATIHAGLECGPILSRCPEGAEAISIGPTIRGAHEARESVYILSVIKFWQLLLELLAANISDSD